MSWKRDYKVEKKTTTKKRHNKSLKQDTILFQFPFYFIYLFYFILFFFILFFFLNLSFFLISGNYWKVNVHSGVPYLFLFHLSFFYVLYRTLLKAKCICQKPQSNAEDKNENSNHKTQKSKNGSYRLQTQN